METVGTIISWIVANYQVVLTAVVAILGGVTAIAMIVPGEQPEKALQGIADFLAKFSKK